MDALSWTSIFGIALARFWPVWAALAVTFALSIRFKRRLGLYGRLFDSPVGMIGFALVMFWAYTALFAPMIADHDVLSQIGQMKNSLPGSPQPGGTAFYLLGGDHLGRDVFSRMVAGDEA